MSDLIHKADSEREPVFQIEFEPQGRKRAFPGTYTLLEVARRSGLNLLSLCGGSGKCSRCKVQVMKGYVSAPSKKEREILDNTEIHQGYRLACQTFANSDLVVRVPFESLSAPERAQIEGLETPVNPEPISLGYEVRLSPPSLSDLRADDERLVRALHQDYDVDLCKIDMEVLRDLSSNLRSWNWRACATVRESELIALTPLPCRHFGMAVDLGTTKIAGFLIDLETGKTEAVKGVMNPQITYGEDVITRIHFALKSKRNAKLLREVILKAINQMAADLSAEVGVQREEIIEAVVVGNTVMHHLLLGLPVDPLARSPHVPAVQCALDMKVRESGISISPGGYVHLLPNIAGFVGADHVAMLLSTGIYKMKGKSLALDIGTNTEISLVNNGEMTCVSCASGPAFEGGHIKCGMRAASGAIEHLYFSGQKVEYFTIDGARPSGICGSGILDAMAQLYLAGILDTNGRMMKNHPNVHSYETRREFVLVSEDTQCGRPAITITQKDIRELQLAKAAISAGIQALLGQAGLLERDIDRVIVAGAFGSYLNISSAVAIGMLPSLPLDRFQQVGNAAGAGARSVLISLNERKKAEHIARHIRYFELANLSEFGKLFLKAISLG